MLSILADATANPAIANALGDAGDEVVANVVSVMPVVLPITGLLIAFTVAIGFGLRLLKRR